jgi:hypothetical protein
MSALQLVWSTYAASHFAMHFGTTTAPLVFSDVAHMQRLYALHASAVVGDEQL